jgi:glutamate transport system permease protein
VEVVTDNLDIFLEGMRRTAELSVLSFILAFVIGIILAGLRVSPVPPLRWASATFIELVRNTPLLVLMFIVVFAFPSIGFTWSYFVSAIVVLSAYTATFVGETVRSGINSALRTVIGPLGGIFIALLKNSGVAVAINVPELTSAANQVGTDTARFIPAFLGAAAAYLILTIPSGFATTWLEHKLAIKR